MKIPNKIIKEIKKRGGIKKGDKFTIVAIGGGGQPKREKKLKIVFTKDNLLGVCVRCGEKITTSKHVGCKFASRGVGGGGGGK